MSNPPLKRARLNPGSHRDLLPLPDNDRAPPIQSIEPRLKRFGGAILQRPTVRTVIGAPTSAWATLQQWEPKDNSTYALDPEDGEWYDEALGQEVMDEPRPPMVKSKKQYRRSRVSVCHIVLLNAYVTYHALQKRPHVVWRDIHCQSYLEELMRWEGRGDFAAEQCPDCKARRVDSPGPAVYRCTECLLPDLVCKICCVKRHRNSPFHRIEVSHD